MSLLCVDKDDHPEAAVKHFEDARTLMSGGRTDGAAYHAGYVVECSLKTIILHDRCYDPVTKKRDPAILRKWHQQLRNKPYGHALEKLLTATVSGDGARYMPPLHTAASVVDEWEETMRYWGPSVTRETADAYLAWADLAVQAVIRMKLDGVL
jgi:hypothetical protein